MSFENLREYFFDLAEKLRTDLPQGSFLRLSMQGEQSQFTRFNHAKIRQTGHVAQAELKLQLIADGKQIINHLTLELGNFAKDFQACRQVLAKNIASLSDLPEDPFISLPDSVTKSENPGLELDFEGFDHVQQILHASSNTDLVGIYAGGHLYDYYWDSMGSRHEKTSSNFNFDYSLQVGGDKAVKRNYAGLKWQAADFLRQIEEAKVQTTILRKPIRKLNPGKYRVYMTPAATDEILGTLLAWGGFSLLAYKSGRSPLQKLYEGSKTLSPLVHISESPKTSIGPLFNSEGLVKPGHLELVKNGKAVNQLISSRSAKEFQAPANGAEAHEAPIALEMAAGTLQHEDILKTLDTGLLIGNLWYLNFSDRLAGRITGMTRFATFWVENGEIQAPTEVMRFDDSAFAMLGENLLALSQNREFALESRTYQNRQRSSTLLPGLLIKDFSLTL